jgi:hypothetical protein
MAEIVELPRFSDGSAIPNRLVRVDSGCVDGLDDARRAPTSTAGIAKKRAQRLYMEETVVRFHRPATIPVKYLEITTGDTVDSGTSSATS